MTDVVDRLVAAVLEHERAGRDAILNADFGNANGERVWRAKEAKLATEVKRLTAQAREAVDASRAYLRACDDLEGAMRGGGSLWRRAAREARVATEATLRRALGALDH